MISSMLLIRFVNLIKDTKLISINLIIFKKNLIFFQQLFSIFFLVLFGSFAVFKDKHFVLIDNGIFQLNTKYFHSHTQTSQDQKVNKHKYILQTNIHVHTHHTHTNTNLKNKL